MALTPEEVQEEQLTAMQEMAQAMKRTAEIQEEANKRTQTLYEKASRDKTADLETQQKYNKDLTADANKRLRIEESTNTDLRKTLDDRLSIEKKVITEAKKKIGDEKFNEIQRGNFFRDQLEKYSQGALAYGGVTSTFRDLNKTQQKQLVDSSRTQLKLQQEQDKFAQTVQKLANPAALVGSMTGGFSTLSGALDTGKDALIKLAGGGIGATVGLELTSGAAKATAAAFEGAAKAAIGMAKSVLNGERGLAVGAKATQTFWESVNGASSSLGTLMMTVGSVALLFAPMTFGLSAVAGAGLIAGGSLLKVGASANSVYQSFKVLAAEINDKLYNAFEELGKLSMTGADGMEGIGNMMHSMGLTSGEFEKYGKIITANSKEMKMFGSTAAEGVKKFVEAAGEIAGPDSDIGRTFRLMGISIEDQIEHTAKYMALQARLGIQQDKNSTQLRDSTKSYIEELDRIAELTGATRKEQETAREAVMKIEELRAAILDEQDKKEKGDTGADARIERLQRYLNVATTFQQMGDAKMAKGAATTGSANGAIIGEEGSAFYIMAQRQGLLKGLEQGGMSKEAIALAARRAYVEQTQSMSGVMRYGSNVGPLAGSAVIAGETKATDAQFIKREAEEKSKLGDKYNQQEFIERLAEERKAKDPTTGQNVNNRIELQKNAINADKFVLGFVKDNFGSFTKATDHFTDAVNLFKDLIGWKKQEEKPGPARAEAAARVQAEINVTEATSKREKLEQEKGRGDPETINARKEEMMARREAERKRAEEESISRRRTQQSDVSGPPSSRQVNPPATNLANLVGRGEGGYNSANTGVAGKSAGNYKLTDMTVGEVQKLQKTGKVHAAGRYQVIPKTFAEAIDALGLKESDKFDEKTQDKIFNDFLIGSKRPAVQALLAGKDGATFEDAIMDMAKEFASIGVPKKVHRPKGDGYPAGNVDVGQSYYEGVAGNHASIGPDEVKQMLLQEFKQRNPNKEPPKAKYGGLFDGPSSGYQVELHGREAVVPMPNPNAMLASNDSQSVQKDPLSSVMKPEPVQANNDNGVLMELFQMLSSKMDTLSDHMASGNDTREELLKYSRV